MGKQTVKWDASMFASGEYLYELKADNGYQKCKKLVILK
jgi:hypothetical protein